MEKNVAFARKMAQEARSKIMNQQINARQDIAELMQTVAMLASAIEALTDEGKPS